MRCSSSSSSSSSSSKRGGGGVNGIVGSAVGGGGSSSSSSSGCSNSVYKSRALYILSAFADSFAIRCGSATQKQFITSKRNIQSTS
ncbi:Hypothetical predicted protein [Octopus vulgaris]|uniref:Uncharacterized protein n=1 Tax=Octopus vulgaris TaxID=6645 RepID=A0AA36F8W2_OCTVU|nr:Hypothetical predicted protein [Octopus vulgaris]